MVNFGDAVLFQHCNPFMKSLGLQVFNFILTVTKNHSIVNLHNLKQLLFFFLVLFSWKKKNTKHKDIITWLYTLTHFK